MHGADESHPARSSIVACPDPPDLIMYMLQAQLVERLPSTQNVAGL